MTDVAVGRVSPFGHPGLTARVQLPQAYRSLPRPSSPLDAKASAVCLIAFDLNIFVLDRAHAMRDRPNGLDSSHLLDRRLRDVERTIHPSIVKEQQVK